MLSPAEIQSDTATAAAAGDTTLTCWCGSARWQICFRTAKFGLIRCTECGCFRIDPPVLQQGEDAQGFYSTYYSKPAASNHQHSNLAGSRQSRFWRVVDQVPVLRSCGQRVLDIGCGDGRLCGELQAAGWSNVIGVDASVPRVEAARRRYPAILFHTQSFPSDRFELEPVDLAIMDNVIEHLADPQAVLEQIRTLLRPGGRLVAITPNMESGHFRLLGRRWTPELAPHTHIFLYTPSALRRLFKSCGYEVEACGTFHLPFYSPRQWFARLFSGDIHGAAWRAMQETGGVFGRLMGAGEMLYVVGRKDAAGSVERGQHG